jgi:deoxycytidine triphosphate deaminase
VCANDRFDPYFRHDCTTCEYVGSTLDENGRVCDLYVHEANDEYIARYSDRDSDYIAHDKAIALQFKDRPTHTALVRYEARKAARAEHEADSAMSVAN